MMGKQEQTRILCLIYILSNILIHSFRNNIFFSHLFAFCNTDSHTMFEAIQGLQGKLQGKPRFPWRTREMLTWVHSVDGSGVRLTPVEVGSLSRSTVVFNFGALRTFFWTGNFSSLFIGNSCPSSKASHEGFIEIWGRTHQLYSIIIIGIIIIGICLWRSV